jgi:hypothetical protein
MPDPELPVAADDAMPQTPQEELVALAFAEVLQRERVGRQENFFEQPPR